MSERKCETCRWWEPDTDMPIAGGCRHPSVVGPFRDPASDADVAVLRFASMTCGHIARAALAAYRETGR